MESIISKITCDGQNILLYSNWGDQIHLCIKFQEIIFIHAKVKLCRKSLTKMEFSIKRTCRSNGRVDKLAIDKLFVSINWTSINRLSINCLTPIFCARMYLSRFSFSSSDWMRLCYDKRCNRTPFEFIGKIFWLYNWNR